MTTATAPPGAAPTATPGAPDWADLGVIMLHNPPGRVVIVSPVAWAEYERLLALRTESRPNVRLAYDRGRLEIMTVGNRHERLKSVLAQLVRVYLEETGGRYSGSGAVTVSRADQARGVEPDESFYIRNVDRVVGTRELDFSTDPPPDLVIEIEVSRSVDVRLPVMAAFRVPEVWRCDGTRLTVLVLRPDGAYAESDRSSAVPGFPLGEVGRYLALAETTDEGTVSREFRAWVRAHLPAAPNA